MTRSLTFCRPEPESWEGEFETMESAQTAARIYRRSGVRIKLAGDSARIFEAVVRPSDDGQGDVADKRRALAAMPRLGSVPTTVLPLGCSLGGLRSLEGLARLRAAIGAQS